MMNRRLLVIVVFGVMLIACNLTRRVNGDPDPASEPTPTPPAPTAPAGLEVSAPGAADWEALAPGIERRTVEMRVGALRTEAVVIRIDPALASFRVHYSPGAARSLDEWRSLLPDAAIIVNGAFFDETDHALGLVVSDGRTYGQTFSGFGGMFQVNGGVRVRSLVGEPYAGEYLVQAVQGFPMLIEAGGVLAPQGDGFDDRSRRTAIGQDWSGRILLVVVPYGFVSLAELQEWLLNSDLDLAIAVGLDGGRSTGLVIQTPAGSDVFPALDRLPSVIAVYSP